MALDMTPEQRELGKANFLRVAEGLTRRDMLKSMALGAAGVSVVGAAAYFGYAEPERPVRVAIIGTGDEGGVLIGALNPKFLEVVAICDIRPSNIKRGIDGDPAIPSLRTGLRKKYGATKNFPVYADYKEMLRKEGDIEAVIIALPLHLHAPATIDCLNAGKHVLCEKLMAWNIQQCKAMIAAAKKNDRILSIGHQRHYSMLYAHAAEVLHSGVAVGDVKMIRALWHRNNSWVRLGPDGRPEVDRITGHPYLRDGWTPPIPQEDWDELSSKVKSLGYESMEELCRWRLFNRTGGGLMAELGSHQLDACSIFLGKVHPISVMGVGGRFFYGEKPSVRDVDGVKGVLRNPRESDDIVAVTYEFPGKGYYERDEHGKPVVRDGRKVVADKYDIVVVTYTSMNTNSFEAYGECVMGSRGTLVVEGEASVMLYPERNPNPGAKGGDPRKTAATVDAAKPGAPAVETGGTWGPPTVGAAGTAPGGAPGAPAAPPSRGYQEEMEDFAYCIRMHGRADAKERELWRVGGAAPAGSPRGPRCHGKVAMADAIIALTANRAMRERQRIEFQHNWFEPDLPDVPDTKTEGA